MGLYPALFVRAWTGLHPVRSERVWIPPCVPLLVERIRVRVLYRMLVHYLWTVTLCRLIQALLPVVPRCLLALFPTIAGLRSHKVWLRQRPHYLWLTQLKARDVRVVTGGKKTFPLPLVVIRSCVWMIRSAQLHQTVSKRTLPSGLVRRLPPIGLRLWTVKRRKQKTPPNHLLLPPGN
nr:hypothetical protein [Blunervirus sp.]